MKKPITLGILLIVVGAMIAATGFLHGLPGNGPVIAIGAIVLILGVATLLMVYSNKVSFSADEMYA